MDELAASIKTVYSGGAMINPDIAAKVFALFNHQMDEESIITIREDAEQEISQTEWEVIRQVGKGRSNKEIASALFLSEGTVRNYLSSILSKFCLRDRTQLAIWAVENRKRIKELVGQK